MLLERVIFGGQSSSEKDLFIEPAAEQSLAADDATAFFPSSLNADRAPQLKASVRRWSLTYE